MEEVAQELTCPITMELLKDPVSLPCCGRACSRGPLVQWCARSDRCPACSQDLPDDFDASTAPRQVLLANLVDQMNGSKEGDEDSDEEAWQVGFHQLYRLTTGEPTSIYELELIPSNPAKAFQGKSLLILALDVSGSMSGIPLTQVNHALTHIKAIASQSPDVTLRILAYGSACREISIHSQEPVGNGGGTNFPSAFKMIGSILKEPKSTTYLSASVIFMTDGQDGSGIQRDKLPDFLREETSTWTKPFTVHTVGFSQHHDFTCMDGLRKAGSVEGVYQYANPDEDSDALASKICSITTTLLRQVMVPAKIGLGGETYKAFSSGGVLRLFVTDPPEVDTLTLEMANGDGVEELSLQKAPSVDYDRWVRWHSKLLDDICGEMIDLSEGLTSMNETNRRLFGHLLAARLRSIQGFLSSPPPDGSEHDESPEIGLRRAKGLETHLRTLMTGVSIERRTLLSAAFEGAIQTEPLVKDVPKDISNATARPIGIPAPVLVPEVARKCLPPDAFYEGYPHGLDTDASTPLHKATMAFSLDEVDKAIGDGHGGDTLDGNGFTALCIAALIGRCNVVDRLLASGCDINCTTSTLTPLTCAIVRGWYEMVDLLVSKGAREINLSSRVLYATLLRQGFVYTSDRLWKMDWLKPNHELIDEDFAEYFDDEESVTWILAHASSSSPEKVIHLSITNGLMNSLMEVKHHLGSYSWQDFPCLLQSPSFGHLEVIDYLITNGHLEVDEHWRIDQPPTLANPEGMKSTGWPLFIAAEKGDEPLARLLLEKGAEINKQTLTKKTTPLWMAACKKRLGMVSLLLEHGADPNMVNMKGDSPLVPVCQKGYMTILRILLDGGADPFLANTNGDNAFLIACRVGGSKVLDVLLRGLDEEGREKAMTTYASVDGFNPLLASTEVNSTSCIKLLESFGASLDCEATPDSTVLPYATPIHIAAFYGRFDALNCLVSLNVDFDGEMVGTGKRPLHLAIEHGHLGATGYLLAKGADREKPDGLGHSPIYYAKAKGNEAIYDAYFHNPLSDVLIDLIRSSGDKDDALDILERHHASLGSFEASDLVSLEGTNGHSLLTMAILYGDPKVAHALKAMGAMAEKPDSTGLPPVFWEDLRSSSGTLTLSDTSLDTRLLTDLRDRPSLTFSDALENQGRLAIRMEVEATKIKPRALTTLQRSRPSPLVPTLASLAKTFGLQKKELDTLIWEGKIGIVQNLGLGTWVGRCIPAGEEETKDDVLSVASKDDRVVMKPSEQLAIYLYTAIDSLGEKMNKEMVGWASGRPRTDGLANFAFTFYKGLQALPPYEGEIYRKVTSKFVEKPLGTKIVWNGFTSATADWSQVSDGDASIVYLIQSKSGRYLGPYSRYPQNSEVVLLPGTSFTITNYFVKNMIVFSQANIRETSYLASPANIEKVKEGSQGIIIELTEE